MVLTKAPLPALLRDSTQLSPALMQGNGLQAFQELEDIIPHDAELSQLRFAHRSSTDQTGPGIRL